MNRKIDQRVLAFRRAVGVIRDAAVRAKEMDDGAAATLAAAMEAAIERAEIEDAERWAQEGRGPGLDDAIVALREALDDVDAAMSRWSKAVRS